MLKYVLIIFIITTISASTLEECVEMEKIQAQVIEGYVADFNHCKRIFLLKDKYEEYLDNNFTMPKTIKE